jgi:hypothetical protein
VNKDSGFGLAPIKPEGEGMPFDTQYPSGNIQDTTWIEFPIERKLSAECQIMIDAWIKQKKKGEQR